MSTFLRSRTGALLLAASLACGALAACSSDGNEGTTGAGGDDDPTTSGTQSAGTQSGGTMTGGSTSGCDGAGGAPTAVCTDPTTVPCEDQVILEMNLQDDISPGLIGNQPDAQCGGFRSTVDATAGGSFASDPDSYTYGKFTDAGLEKVEISDEDSLTSMDWDIAFRRYVVRINSGHSGPSCVSATRLPGTPVYDEVTAVPGGLNLHKDEYFTDSCEIIADGTGLPGSPATALASYWTYPGCVQMTGYIYIVELADGRHLKLTIESYYDATNHESCQTMDTVVMGENGAANFVVRWAYLP